MSRAVGSIRRLAIHGDLVRRLVEADHPKTGSGIFQTYRELACFAAVLGFDADRRMSITGPSEILVDGRIFVNSDTALDLLYLIGLAATRDQCVLLDQDDQASRLVESFEEYANGGLAILSEWLAADPADVDGDRAILSGMRDGGYLSRTDVVSDLDSVTF